MGVEYRALTMSRFLTIPPDHWEKSREMRKNPTRAERALWRAVRSSALKATFRRQHPIGPYIVDFVCLEARLVIEVDGGGHVEPDQAEYGKMRGACLMDRGFRVRRYSNRDVLQNLDGVLKDIAGALKE
jgi:very-short-patch-repair endonuclease